MLLLVLTGCSLPKTTVELENINRKEIFCNQDDLNTTIGKIYGRLALCYNRSTSVPVVLTQGSINTNIKSSSKIVEKKSDNGEPIYYVVSDGYFGLKLALKKGEIESCPTKITAYTMNFAWDKHVDRVKTWLVDPKAGCQAW